MRLFAVLVLICAPLSALLYIYAPALWYVLEVAGALLFLWIWKTVSGASWSYAEMMEVPDEQDEG